MDPDTMTLALLNLATAHAEGELTPEQYAQAVRMLHTHGEVEKAQRYQRKAMRYARAGKTRLARACLDEANRRLGDERMRYGWVDDGPAPEPGKRIWRGTPPDSGTRIQIIEPGTRGKGGTVKPAAGRQKRPSKASVDDALASDEYQSFDDLERSTGMSREEMAGRLSVLMKEGKLDTDGLAADGEPGYRLKSASKPASTQRESNWSSQDEVDAQRTRVTGRPVYSELRASDARLDEVGKHVLTAMKTLGAGHDAMGLIPIHEVRKRVPATRREFDDAVKKLRYEDVAWLTAASDLSEWTPEQLKKSIPGDQETFTSVRFA